ncbi:hypothetical protein Drorol1_Dr00018341 [Drosera rotundifolia]
MSSPSITTATSKPTATMAATVHLILHVLLFILFLLPILSLLVYLLLPLNHSLSATVITTIPRTTTPPPFPSFPPLPSLPLHLATSPVSAPQLSRILESLLGALDFSSLSATLFIPQNDSNSTAQLDPSVFLYHIVPRRLDYADLRELLVGSRVLTLLSGRSHLVTENRDGRVEIDGVLVTVPDLFLEGPVAGHGIGGVFDYVLFGNRTMGTGSLRRRRRRRRRRGKGGKGHGGGEVAGGSAMATSGGEPQWEYTCTWVVIILAWICKLLINSFTRLNLAVVES